MSIILEHVTHAYMADSPLSAVALSDVSLEIPEGIFLGVIGHTGSGKSTLVQHLNGLLLPTEGRVLVDGLDTLDKKQRIKARQLVGMVFQYPEYQLFEETVIKDICFGPMNQGLSEEEALKRAKEAAFFVGLPDHLLEKSPFELSGGEKRRAAIAGVIAMDPDVLILDEPTAGLDPMGRDLLLTQIYNYHKERKNTVLLVSHSMEDIGRVADRVLVMNKGEKAMLENTRDVFSKGYELRDMGLKIPQVTHIMQKLKLMGLDVDEGTLRVEDALRQLIPLLKK